MLNVLLHNNNNFKLLFIVKYIQKLKKIEIILKILRNLFDFPCVKTHGKYKYISIEECNANPHLILHNFVYFCITLYTLV